MPAGRVRSLSVQGGRRDSPFFRSKFRVPTTPHQLVHRMRLIYLLDDLSAYPVTAVVAPAGAGKTAWPLTGSSAARSPPPG